MVQECVKNLFAISYKVFDTCVLLNIFPYHMAGHYLNQSFSSRNY